MEKAVEALDLDASDFINKPVERQALNSALARAEKRKQLPGNQGFECSEKKQEGNLFISLKGKLTASAMDVFSGKFKSGALNGVEQVYLILDDGFSIDRSGISLLTDVIQGVRQKGIRVFMENLSYNYARVFQMAGIDKLAVLKEALPED
jgi:anti-anti-sigma factor